jgi:hypothetical protein
VNCLARRRQTRKDLPECLKSGERLAISRG